MTEDEKRVLAEVLVDLIRTDGAIRAEIWHCTCQCPNLVVEY